MNSVFSSRLFMGAAIAGLVGAAGMFIYEQIYAEKRRAMLMEEMIRLDSQLSTIRSEVENLKELQKERNMKRQKHRKLMMERREKARAVNESCDKVDAPDASCASDSEYFTDYQSIAGTDGEMGSDEFYDVNSDEDTLKEILNGQDSEKDISDDDTISNNSLHDKKKL